MISGVRSLCSTHEQVILAWTGDIEHTGPPSGGGASGPTSGKGSKATLSSGTRGPVPSSSLTDEDKAILELEIANYRSPHDKEIVGKGMSYVPVFLDDKIAHGHYEGYCKTSMFFLSIFRNKGLITFLSSSLAALPLSALARCRYGGHP
jgi:trehalose 6-phosphate synthase/phosphatase